VIEPRFQGERFEMIFVLHNTRPGCRSARALPVLGLILVLSSGCGGGNPVEPGLVQVKGRVTLNGGPWPKPGALFFMPKEAPDTNLLGVATFDTSGKFEKVEGGYGGATGLHPGFYWVSVQCKEGDEAMPEPGKTVVVKNYVPESYQDPSTSGLTLKVEAGKPAEVTFDVTKK
jgi:hypothetical protein